MWYYASASSGDYEGPFHEDYLGRQLRAGVIHKGTLVWRDGFSEWLPLAETELAELLQPQAPWKTTPRYEPPPLERSEAAPTRAEHHEADYEQDYEQDPLGGYEQRGYERPQSSWDDEAPFDPPGPRRRRAPQQHRPGAGSGRGPGSSSSVKGAAAANATNASDWRDLSGLTQVLTMALVLSAIASFMRLLHELSYFHAFRDHDAQTRPLLEIPSNLTGMAFLLSTVLFYLWLYRAIRNLPVLGAKSVDLSPGFVIVSFYLPILNLFLPFLAMRKLWRASFNPRQWPTQRVGIVVTILWVSWVLGRHGWIGPDASTIYAIQLEPEASYLMSTEVLSEAFGCITFIATAVFVNAVWRAQAAGRNAGVC
jgi:hypothetical protein